MAAICNTLVRPLPSNPELLEKLGPLVPIESLIYYDGPLLYTAHDAAGALMLVYWYDYFREERYDTYLVMPLNQAALDNLIANRVSLLATLNQPVVWALDWSYDTGWVRATELSGVMGLPIETLPNPDVYLTEDRPG